MATTRFGYREWNANGELVFEQWIDESDLAGAQEARTSTPHTKKQWKIRNKSRPRGQSREAATSSESSNQSSSPSTTPGTSIESMSTDVKANGVSAMASSPSHAKKEGFFKRHLHHRRRSSVNGFSSDVSQSPPQPVSRPPTAARQAPSQLKSAPQRPPLTSGQTSNDDDDDDYQPAPEIVLNAVNSVRNEFAGVSYPDGLTTPPANSKNKGTVKWAENFGQTPPTRPRRTSSAATHGRRSSIYSKAADGDYLEGQGVDAGVGSKARRLSVVLPDQLLVDECSLEEHFNKLARVNRKEIGEGGAAVVRLMKSKTAGNGKGQVLAVKEFRARDPEEESEPEYVRKIKSEYAIAKACQHPNVVETFRLCVDKEGKWFHVMTYCQLGDLNDLINKSYFSEEDRNCLFKQLVRGVDFLHRCGIAHRDLKSENLLLDESGCLKIADFGTAEVFCGQHPGARNCRRQSVVDPEEPIRMCEPGWVGSRPYMAPELYQRLGEYDPRAVDVWSCGIVYITLMFGANVWDYASPECRNFNIYCSTWDQWKERYPDGEIKKGRPLPGFSNTKQWLRLDQDVKVFLFGMLHPDPAKRWSINDVLNFKVIEMFPCCQQEGYCDDIKKRQKKSLHNHVPPKEAKGPKFLKPSYDSK